MIDESAYKLLAEARKNLARRRGFGSTRLDKRNMPTTKQPPSPEQLIKMAKQTLPPPATAVPAKEINGSVVEFNSKGQPFSNEYTATMAARAKTKADGKERLAVKNPNGSGWLIRVQ